MCCVQCFREMQQVKCTLRKPGSQTGDEGYTAALPALFQTVTATATRPRVARVARASSTVTCDEGGAGAAVKTEPTATPLPQRTFPTSSTQPVRYNCVDPSCPVTFTRLASMRRHAAQFHKLRADGEPATEAEHEAAVLAAAERTARSRVDVNGRARQQVKRSIKTEIGDARRRASFQRQVKTKIKRSRRFKCVDPSCAVMFTRLVSMHRHAVQFHKLRTDGEPATEAEHEAAILAAAERTAGSQADAIGHATRRVTSKRSVKTRRRITLPWFVKSDIERRRRFKCVDPSCPLMFTRLGSMRRHAVQFHKLRGVGEPATEAEHEAAVLAAAERSAWCGVYGNGQPVRFKRSVKSEIERLADGEEPTRVDSPDLPEVQAQSVSEAAMHRSFDDQQIQAPATERELIRERRPEDRAATSYLHRLLQAKPTLPIRDIANKAIRHGWAGNSARRARLIANHLETGRQKILNDIRAFIPQTLDHNTALPFALRVQQYLAQFPPRPQ